MADWFAILAEAVRLHGAAAVARSLSMPVGTVVSVVAGTSREGSRELARSRIGRLSTLQGRSGVASCWNEWLS